jgi:hypothetical protein
LTGALLFALTAPSILDSLIRGILVSVSRGKPAGSHIPIRRWLVLIPARDEGLLIVDTVASVRDAAAKQEVDVLVVLDGSDTVAAEQAKRLGADVLEKHPAGPTKGALLRWVAQNHRERVEQADAVLLVDVGSALSPAFFESFRWDTGSDAMQARLRGGGVGAAEAALVSESLAQAGEDEGRQILGWNVRLRGTGTALTPEAFLALVPRLATQVEDLEASLLLAADGMRMTLAGPEAFVADVKPHSVRDAAIQRARWFAGKLEVFMRHAPALYGLIARKPLEGIAFVCEMLGRPIALTVPLRLIAALVLFMGGLPDGPRWALPLAAVAFASAVADIAMLRRGGASIAGAAKMALAWVGAVLMSPRALIGWMRARH